MLVQDFTPKLTLKAAAAGWVTGLTKPPFLIDKFSKEKKIPLWAIHIILKEKT